MAKLKLANFDFNKNEIQNARVQNLASAPSSPVEGQIYWDTTGHRFYGYNANASAWQNLATNSDLLGGQNSAYHLSRTNHSGSQLAATISDFDTQVRTSRLDQMAAPTASVSMGSQLITNVATAVSGTDAVNLTQATALAAAASAGIDAKASCRYMTTANITLSGLGTAAGRDWGSSITAGDRILVINQTAGAENGIYVAASGSWTRATDCNSTANYTPQAFTYVEESNSSYAGSQWKVSTTGSFTVGTTSITWAQFGASLTYTADSTGGLQLTGSAFSVKLPGSSGLIKDSTGLYIDTAIVTRKYSVDVGDGTSTSITITHNLGTRDVIAMVAKKASTYDEVECEVLMATTNTITLIFTVAPTSAQFRVTVLG